MAGASRPALIPFFFFFSLIKTLWSQINFLCSVFVVSPVLEEGWAGLGTQDLQQLHSLCQLPRTQAYNQGRQMCLQQTPSLTEYLLQRVSVHQSSIPQKHPRTYSWPQKESVSELRMPWVSQTCRTGQDDADRHCYSQGEHTGLS